MKNAWVDNGVVRDTCSGDPSLLFTTEIAANYITAVADDIKTGATLVNGVWTNPPYIAPAVVASKIKTQLEFLNLFTDAELVGIYTAAKSSVPIEVFLEKFRAATQVDLTDARTIGGLHALEAAGLLAAGRAAVILA